MDFTVHILLNKENIGKKVARFVYGRPMRSVEGLFQEIVSKGSPILALHINKSIGGGQSAENEN